MKTIPTLQREAIQAAIARKHRLGKFTPQDLWGSKQVYRAICLNANCNCYVDVNGNPASNEIDIGGTAVALNCGN